MAKVYRVASVHDGRGPFNTCTPGYCAWNEELWTARTNGHPAPYDDGLTDTGYDSTAVYGCDSKEQLDEWFGEGFRRAHADKFNIEVHTIPDEHVERGRHQVRFEPEHVVTTERFPMAASMESLP